MKRLILSIISGVGVAIILFAVLRPEVLRGLYFSLQAVKIVMLYIPEYVLYLFLVVIVAWVLLAGLYRDIVLERYKPKVKPRNMGPIEALSLEITKAQRKKYFRWILQNRLAKIAQKIIAYQDCEPIAGKMKLDGTRWNPPPAINAYLENGLRSQHGNKPRDWYSRLLDYRLRDEDTPTVSDVIDYLLVAESEI